MALIDTLRKFGGLLGYGEPRRRASTTQWLGTHGYSVYAGYVDHAETARKLASHDERFKTFDDILVNTSIVAASVRYYLSLVGKAEWGFVPSEMDRDGMYAERLEEILMSDIRTPWHRVVRRSAMYRFYGFSVQEWIIRRRADGWLTYGDVRSRPQHTITRWDVDEEGLVRGMVQQNPQDQQYLYLPRDKVLYILDDALSDLPTGIGLLRHLVAPAERLKRYEQLEGFGFELDLRNVPVMRAPLEEIARRVEAGELTPAQASALLEPQRAFLRAHAQNEQRGMMLDSKRYATHDEAQRPSTSPEYDLELLSGSQTNLADVGRSIQRLNREMARILGTDNLLLGETAVGSLALSKDKTGQFFLMVEGALTEIREQVIRDLVEPIWRMNGWPDDMMPETTTQPVSSQDVEGVARVLRDMATAGSVLDPNDPAIDAVRDMMDLPHTLTPDELDRLVQGMADDDPEDDDPTGGEPDLPAREGDDE